MKQRDMTAAQFNAKCKEYGFVKQGFMGYYQLPEPFSKTRVSVLNAGISRRAQLAYLMAEWSKAKVSR